MATTPHDTSEWAAYLHQQRDRTEAAARASVGASAAVQAVLPAVTIRDLAQRLNMDRSACRRYVLRLGYRPTKQRTVDSGYQLALTVTAAQAREIQSRRAAEGYCSHPT